MSVPLAILWAMELVLNVAILVVNTFSCSGTLVMGAMILVRKGTKLKVCRRRQRLVGCLGSWSFKSLWYL